MLRQSLREIKSAQRAASPLGAVLCIDFIGGAVLELLTHRKMVDQVTSLLEAFGLKLIQETYPSVNSSREATSRAPKRNIKLMHVHVTGAQIGFPTDMVIHWYMNFSQL